jgi:DNA-binding MarR family transcriptional regulator
MLGLRDLPKPENLRDLARRFPEVDPSAVEACLTILQVATDVLIAVDHFLAHHDLSLGRFTVLMILMRNPDKPVMACEIADKAGVTRATITGLLDGLEREGLIRREQVAGDRRAINIRLTARGVKFLAPILPDHFRRVATLMSHLTEKDRKKLIDLSRKIGLGLNTAYHDME